MWVCYAGGRSDRGWHTGCAATCVQYPYRTALLLAALDCGLSRPTDYPAWMPCSRLAALSMPSQEPLLFPHFVCSPSLCVWCTHPREMMPAELTTTSMLSYLEYTIVERLRTSRSLVTSHCTARLEPVRPASCRFTHAVVWSHACILAIARTAACTPITPSCLSTRAV